MSVLENKSAADDDNDGGEEYCECISITHPPATADVAKSSTWFDIKMVLMVMVMFTVLMVIIMVMPIITTGPAKSPGIATAQGFVGSKPFAPPYGATFFFIGYYRGQPFFIGYY